MGKLHVFHISIKSFFSLLVVGIEMIPSNSDYSLEQSFYICSDSGCLWRAELNSSWNITTRFLDKRSSIASFALIQSIRSSALQDYLVIAGDMLDGEIVLIDYDLSIVRQMVTLSNDAPITDFVVADVDGSGYDSIYLARGNVDGRIQRISRGINASLQIRSRPEFAG